VAVRIFPSLLGAAALAITIPPAVAAPNDRAQARAAIDKANADWLPALRGKDSGRLAEAYAEDGVFVLPNGQEIVGRPAITAFYRRRVEGLAQVLAGGIHHDGMAQAADGLVYEWGHGGATTVDKEGRRSTTGGPYLTVWKRMADGRWAIVRNLVF